MRDPWARDSDYTGQYRDGDPLWYNVPDSEKTRIGYEKNL